MASTTLKGKEPARPLARIDVDHPPKESLLPVESNLIADPLLQFFEGSDRAIISY
ncbi:hypothetical protein BDV37DRAFT_290051 [Aspergillus pseudonomiae]|uniref:Uncharacterized protein n=1 Tax=Aspergillus pseudonomiae TaxID=1506151 RepID=A0A5N7CRJ5_9EURO|nr:uncharacterized protein BDV37DRAFT_290051 [Aspergillus pseudonomiae]KAE8396745.1 hypothetical protein BDV37DRAFT_290051 [Aspergillus pseudonomiae]